MTSMFLREATYPYISAHSVHGVVFTSLIGYTSTPAAREVSPLRCRGDRFHERSSLRFTAARLYAVGWRPIHSGVELGYCYYLDGYGRKIGFLGAPGRNVRIEPSLLRRHKLHPLLVFKPHITWLRA
jgi:hypothetical protein